MNLIGASKDAPSHKNNMHSDSFFYKGKTHNICEDYALGGTAQVILDADCSIQQIPIAIVSDGCSSSKDTDLGSRIISKVAADNASLLIAEDLESFGSAVIFHARRIILDAGWDLNCLDATLLITASTEEYTDIFVAGDGVVMLVHDKDNYTIHDITYPSGAPRYLNYWHDPERAKGYAEKFGELRVVYSHHFNKDVVSVSNNTSTSPFWNTRISNSDFESVILMSDGVHSFQQLTSGESKLYKPVPMIEVVKELTSFKSMSGEFVTRKLKRFAKTTMWENMDDVSVSAIHLR